MSRRPLTVKPNNMKYGEIAGVGKKISRLVMGVDHPRTEPYAAALFDDFVERGATAWIPRTFTVAVRRRKC